MQSTQSQWLFAGGELFEYILARRYLKEKDAKRLFAQLISGVRYMHEKHIVHRDLKLVGSLPFSESVDEFTQLTYFSKKENLLLDRHRNVIITDFGFANQFAAAKDDLMATSCGSPCYAAPELVVSDGLYVGSAVDIWSCGVILYAMLCGYLPFDDDPANPDGENINLLYRYILNTPLMFPSHIGSEARDLLRIMLVPDPQKRCSIQDIMKHRWLKDYKDLFNMSLEQLEADAMDAVEKASPVTNHHTGDVAMEPRQDENTEQRHTADSQVVPSNDPDIQDLAVGREDDLMQISGISLEDHHVPSSPDSDYADAMEVQEGPSHDIPDAKQTSLEEVRNDTPVSTYQTPIEPTKDNHSDDSAILMDIETTTPEIDTPPNKDAVDNGSKSAAKDISVSLASDIALKEPQQQSNSQQHSDSRRASVIPTSILQSRFLSSMQRSQSAGVASSTPAPNNDSSRSVSFNTQPKPDTPASTRTTTKSGSQSTSGLFARGTRQKALSLLTRPTSDLDEDMAPPAPRARRNSSLKPSGASQAVRLVVNGIPKGATEHVSKWGSVSLVPSLSERPVGLDQKSKTKGFMEWFRKKAHGMWSSQWHCEETSTN